jgi:hypothetical protein
MADFPAPPIKIRISAQVITDNPMKDVAAQFRIALPSGLFNVSKSNVPV